MCKITGRKLTALVLLLTFVFMALPTEAMAMNKTAVVNEDRVNIRVAPGTKNTSLGKVNKGDIVTITDTQGEWFKVSTKTGLNGWLAGWLVDIQEAEQQGVIVEDIVNVRSGPGTHFDKVGQLKKGDKVGILSKENDWYKIQLSNGQVGWIASWLIQVGNNPTNPDTNVKPEESKPTQPSEGIAYNKTVVVTGENVNVRSGPGTNYSSVGKVNVGTELKATVEKDNWLKVTLANGQVGWIAKWLTVDQGTSGSGSSSEVVLNLSEDKKMVIKDNQSNLHVGITNVSSNGYKLSASNNVLDIQISGLNNKPQTYPLAKFGVKEVQVTGELVKIIFDQPFTYSGQHQSSPAGLNVMITYKEAPDNVLSLSTFAPGKNNSTVEFNIGEKTEYKVVQQNATELVMELTGAMLNSSFSNQRATFGPIKTVKATEIGEEKVRIEIEMAEETKCNVSRERNKLVVNVSNKANGLSGKLIVLDPGHGSIQSGGWTDPGAGGRILKINERDAVLDIALETRRLLEAAGATVVMTHDTGRTSLSLAGRAKVANDLGADIFVSIHANSNDSPTPSGSEVYYYAPSHIAELNQQKVLRKDLAQCIQTEIVKSGGRKDRGIKEANFAVLRETRVPSVLVETAFISNPTEEALLNDKEFKDSMALGIFKGIEKYFSN